MLRITGGRYRGRTFEVPRGVRPTTELARKAAFDILGSRIAGATVLDACAGSGAYGLEALSRGAVHVTFVETSRAVREVLLRNIERLGVAARSTVDARSVAAYVAFAGSGGHGSRFDVIFHDPPFGEPSDQDLARLLSLLSDGGALVHERGDARTPEIGRAPDDLRRYGRTRLLFFEG